MVPQFPSPFWFLPTTAPCAACRGTGLVWPVNAWTAADCPACLGTGHRARPTTAPAVRHLARCGGAVLALLAVVATI